MAPNVALRLSRLSTIALAGTTTLPVMRNSTVKVTRAIRPAATGTLAAMAAFESTNCADWPPTRVENGAGRWRIVFASVSPRADWGSTVGTAENQVPEAPPGAVNLDEAAFGGATRVPAMYEPVAASTRPTPGTRESSPA